MTSKSRGNCTVSLPQMRSAKVGVCLATLLCRARPATAAEMDRSTMSESTSAVASRVREEVILRENLDYANQTIASATAQGQLAYYQMLEEQGHMQMIRTASDLQACCGQWQQAESADDLPIGYILSMEGTDPIVDPAQAQWWWDRGLRTACLAHYGPSAYAMGTGGDGPLTANGRALLTEFGQLGMVLDLVHTADSAVAEALERFDGPVFVSHGNCRALVPHDRQFCDEQIRMITQRGGVFGMVLDGWMLIPNWRQLGENGRASVGLANVADHIDHICQLAGNCEHVGIGSDLDGGFGTEQCPQDLETIADLHKLEPILSDRGYRDEDIDAILHGNWLRFFSEALPA